MKILYVDIEHEYGIKTRGLNTVGLYGFKGAFEKLGHEVRAFYYDDFLDKKKELQDSLLFAAEEFNPDLVYFVLYQDQIEPQTLLALKQKYTTVNWFGDDQWRFDNFTRHYAPNFTWSITTDPFSISKYKALGINNVFLSQWAALDVPLPSKSEYLYDVSFVGAYNSVREWFLDELKKRGHHVNVFGYGWPQGSVTASEMMQVFNRSRINLNMGNSNSFDLRYLTHRLKNPISAMRAQKNASQMKARNFEIPYAGGFQLSDYIPKLERYFDLKTEIACYSTVEEASLQINYYMENDVEREQIKEAGILRARKEHTYLSRHREFFEKIV